MTPEPSPAQPLIRRPVAEEREAVSATVAAAFAQDPAWAFIFGDDYERLAPAFIAVILARRLRSQSVWVSADLAAVAMWDPPSRGAPASHQEAEWRAYRELAGEDAYERLQRYNAAVEAAASPQPHWYLGVLATAPRYRRQGLASAVMRPVLELADRAGIPCCLETSTPANRRFYEGRGFSEVTGIELPGGPRSWWLRRPAP
jgi:GNAT superfamily N-acetyltransferase